MDKSKGQFPDASGWFLLKNLMRNSSWQGDGVSFQPVQPRSNGACKLKENKLIKEDL